MNSKHLWPVLSILLGVSWLGLIVADGFYAADHRWGQGISETQGHLALLGLALLVLARPLRPWLPQLPQERRWLGLTTLGFALTHTLSTVKHSLGGRWDGVLFLEPNLQLGLGLGAVSLGLLLPLALTSFDKARRALGPFWQKLHWLIFPAAILAVLHTLGTGVHYLNLVNGAGLVVVGLAVGWLRWALLTPPANSPPPTGPGPQNPA
ncbi:ferric reductase-like transmembrane domain-containing protein [Candidatus Cyanaurora vandensis]|uniref:ferric reductase-like transmembrane domain-containing protein n=1 Tax=Candidatus Cyanaurora vandensis TaxID=2714958 RepID=UPI00257BA3DF|nr:ferric reductase-like transmembrane domain-containing protein [Candidatus Cyanaurora vandensis]